MPSLRSSNITKEWMARTTQLICRLNLSTNSWISWMIWMKFKKLTSLLRSSQCRFLKWHPTRSPKKRSKSWRRWYPSKSLSLKYKSMKFPQLTNPLKLSCTSLQTKSMKSQRLWTTNRINRLNDLISRRLSNFKLINHCHRLSSTTKEI